MISAGNEEIMSLGGFGRERVPEYIVEVNACRLGGC